MEGLKPSDRFNCSLHSDYEVICGGQEQTEWKRKQAPISQGLVGDRVSAEQGEYSLPLPETSGWTLPPLRNLPSPSFYAQDFNQRSRFYSANTLCTVFAQSLDKLNMQQARRAMGWESCGLVDCKGEAHVSKGSHGCLVNKHMQ